MDDDNIMLIFNTIELIKKEINNPIPNETNHDYFEKKMFNYYTVLKIQQYFHDEILSKKIECVYNDKKEYSCGKNIKNNRNKIDNDYINI